MVIQVELLSWLRIPTSMKLPPMFEPGNLQNDFSAESIKLSSLGCQRNPQSFPPPKHHPSPVHPVLRPT